MTEITQSITPTTSPYRKFKGHEGLIAAISVFPDGGRMVTGSHDMTLRLWDLESGTMLKKMEGHHRQVEAVVVSGDGQWIASGDLEGKLIIWRGDTGNLTKAIQGHSDRITSLDFSPDSSILVTVSLDKRIQLWRTENWHVQVNPIDSGEKIYCVRHSPSSQLVAIATLHDVQIWNPCASTPERIAKFRAVPTPAWHTSLTWTPDGTHLFSAGSRSNPIIQQWDASTWRQVGEPCLGHADRVCAIAVNSTGTLIASASKDNHVRLWRLSDQQAIAIFKHSQSVHCVAFSADGKRIFGGCRDANITEWTIPDHSLLKNSFGAPNTPLQELPLSLPGAHATIQRIIHAQLENAPLRLLDTSTGRICNRNAQISSFKGSKEYKKLLSSAMRFANLRLERVQDVVMVFFQYVMLSHRWEGEEPLLRDILGKSVYELNPVDGIVKLQSFCKATRDRGYRWAWIDTCCIDKNNTDDVQKSADSMFIWYRHSALTIIYLSDVPPSSRSGALATSAWITRGWTLQEFLAPKVVLFYQNDWTLYLNDHSPNHKKSIMIMQELAAGTGINPQALVSFRPEMKNARIKLQWASRRYTALPEDTAYSLFGMFGIHLPVIYGEGSQNALGRLLQEIVARSGDISCLDWVGQVSEFNSCLPASISSYAAPSYELLLLSEDEMETSVSSLRDPGVVELASQLYTTLYRLNTPRFVNRRLHLPCIAFVVTEVTRMPSQGQETNFTYAVKADGRCDLLVTTEDRILEFAPTMPIKQSYLLVRPWDRNLLELGDVLEPSDLAGDAQSIMTEDSLTPPSSPLHNPSDVNRRENVSFDSKPDLRALRLVVHLAQPFRALLLAESQSGEYHGAAADRNIIVQVKDMASICNATNIRTLQITTLSNSSVSTFVCQWTEQNRPCNATLSHHELSNHLQIHLGSLPSEERFCPWANCGRNRPFRRHNIMRHIREVHLGMRRARAL